MLQQTVQVVANTGRKFTTEDIQPWHRKAWLREVIGREYADVEIIPPAAAPLFNEMTLYPWQELQLSVIHSNSITIERGAREISHADLDNYFAVVLLKGRYALQQQGREVFLKPGGIFKTDCVYSACLVAQPVTRRRALRWHAFARSMRYGCHAVTPYPKPGRPVKSTFNA